MAKISTPAVSSSMYRHFAILTVVATLLVAVFASGENRQAFAEEMEARQRAAESAEFAKHKFGAPRLVQSEPAQARLYNSAADYRDTDADYGAPMDRTGSRARDSAYFEGSLNRGGGQYVPASYTAHQISEEDLARLTPAQRQALLAQMANGGLSQDPAVRKRQIASLAAASQRRSGSEAGVE